jgi:hypothetical protein
MNGQACNRSSVSSKIGHARTIDGPLLASHAFRTFAGPEGGRQGGPLELPPANRTGSSGCAKPSVLARGPHVQASMRVDFVAIIDPCGELLLHDSPGVVEAVLVNGVAFETLDEGLGHAVGLAGVRGRRADEQPRARPNSRVSLAV